MSLKIAIQKSGRLYDESISLLKKCGLKIDNAKGQLKAPLKGYDAEAYFLRNSDIPQYLADGVVDLAIIGENVLFKNGLEEREIILESEAVLAVNKNSYQTRQADIDELVMRMKSVTAAKENKYILFNVPNEKIAAVSKIIPAMKSPTILPLSADGWSSMHSVIAQSDFWKVIAELRQAGAEGILVIPIDNMIK